MQGLFKNAVPNHLYLILCKTGFFQKTLKRAEQLDNLKTDIRKNNGDDWRVALKKLLLKLKEETEARKELASLIDAFVGLEDNQYFKTVYG